MFSESVRLAYLDALSSLDFLLNDSIIGPWLLMMAVFFVWVAVLAY